MIKFVYTVLLLIPFHFLKAQSLEPIVKQTAQLFERSQQDLFFPKENDSLFLEQFVLTDSTYIDHQLEYNRLRAENLEQDLGLALNVRALYNLRGDFEEDVNNYTKSRLRTELEWNILESGLLENKIAAKKLQNTNQLLALQQQVQERIAWRRQFRIDYPYSINVELIELLTAKEEFFFKRSYEDPWNPKKSSLQAKRAGL